MTTPSLFSHHLNKNVQLLHKPTNLTGIDAVRMLGSLRPKFEDPALAFQELLRRRHFRHLST
jgi:hypothetical protein